MSPLRQFLLSLYYCGSYPDRAWRNARRNARGKAPAIILFYHRIADDRANPWTCSNAMFARQVRWLRQRFEMVSLAEAQRRVRSGHNDRPCVTITFDDGYSENCEQALPLLIREQIPCTYFVASQHVLEGWPFPHDAAQGRPLPPNTPAQIRELAAAGIDIGAHTRTHADLGKPLGSDRLYEEIVVARDELEQIIGQRVAYFAFPYGQHSHLRSAAVSLARDHGYDGVCSAYGGFNFPGDDPFHLQRIHVDDDMIGMKNWVTVDPRKLRSTTRYQVPAPVGPAVVASGASA
jgi:peptidoglycan/xylan/chitin deacetylase (PgdA/CDA1 family)